MSDKVKNRSAVSIKREFRGSAVPDVELCVAVRKPAFNGLICHQFAELLEPFSSLWAPRSSVKPGS